MKKGILLFVMLLLSCQQLSPVYSSDLTDDYFDIATNYFNSNNYAKALEYLDSILNIEPANLQARILKNKISPPPVEKVNEDLVTKKPLENSKKPDNFVALDVPQVDIDKIVCNSQYYTAKGIEFYNKCEFDIAIEYFFRAISVDKFNAVAYNNLALAYQGKNATSFAIKYFKIANSLNKSYTQPLVNLSMLYNRLGQDDKVVYYLKKATRDNKQDYLAYYNLGEFYQRKSKYVQAIQSYKSAVKINPKFVDSYLNLAICYNEMQDFNCAQLVLNKYIESKSDFDYAYYLLAKSYFGMAQFDNAKNSINKAISINSKGEYVFELAKIEYVQGDYNSSIVNLKGLLQTGGVTAEFYNYLGLCSFKLQNYDVALANFKKAIAMDSFRPMYYYNLALVYKINSDNKNFEKYLEKAKKIKPINYQDFLDLSYIYMDNGDSLSALCVLNSAIWKFPNYKPFYLAKLKIYEANKDTLHYNDTKNLLRKRFD